MLAGLAGLAHDRQRDENSHDEDNEDRVGFKLSALLVFHEVSQWRPIILLSRMGHVGNDAMTIPDYVAIAVLIMLMLWAVVWTIAPKVRAMTRQV